MPAIAAKEATEVTVPSTSPDRPFGASPIPKACSTGDQLWNPRLAIMAVATTAVYDSTRT